MPVRHVTLEANVVQTVSCEGDFSTVAVFPYGGAVASVWVNVADTDPTEAGDDCYVVPFGARRVIDRPGQIGTSDARLLSTAAVVVEVEYA